MKLARVISLLLSVLLLISLCVSCTSSCEKPGPSDISGTSGNPSEWLDDENESNGDFDDGDESTIPGDNTNSDNSDNNENDDYDENDDSDNVASNESNPSLFLDKDSMMYYYQTDNYAYGITESGAEVLAMIDDDGEYFDTFSGAGNVVLKGLSGTQLLSGGTVAEYTRSLQNGSLAVTVTYNYIDYFGFSENTAVTATYIFYDEHVNITYRIAFSADEEISQSKSYIGRGVYNEYESVEKYFTSKWNFPTDNDAPFRTTESYVAKMIFDDEHVVYTYNYGNVATSNGVQSNPNGRYFGGRFFQSVYPSVNVPLMLGYFDGEDDGPRPTKSIDFEAKYAVVFATGENPEKDAYRSYFLSTGSSFAAGISPVTKNDDNTTLFVKDKVKFNLNITNLYDDELVVDVRYDVRDFYGNIIDCGIYLGSTVFGLLDANREITIDANKTGYGMYFITMKVFTKRYTFYDYMPVILLKSADYPYRSSFPFGIAHVVEAIEIEDQQAVLTKTGCGYLRNFITTINDKQTIERNIKALTALKQVGMFIPNMTTGTDDFLSAAATKRYETYGKYFDYFKQGNEFNLKINSQSNPTKEFIDSTWKDYYNNTYLLQKQIAKKYDFIITWAGNSAGMRNWTDKYEAAGLWKTPDLMVIHTYSYSYMSPDNPKTSKQIWSAEGGLIRTKSAVDEFAKKYNGYKKRWVIDETGYSSVNRGINPDPRTKSDYDIRCLILSAAYGAERAEVYSLFDYANYGPGCYQNDVEYGYGAFYVPDQFGRILPKPTAMAMVTLANGIRGYKSCVESSVYSNGLNQDLNGGGKLRVFDINTTVDGHVFVAWSNNDPMDCDIVGGGVDYDPHLPWDPTNFKGTENLVMDAIGSTVKVVSLGGKTTTYKAVGGKVTIPVTGSPVLIYGAK